MFLFCITLLFTLSADAKPDPSERFPKQFIKLLQKGGWTPTPTNSGRYQVGDVFDFSRNKKIIAGTECFKELPEPAPMADINIINMLKGGLTVPFGVLKGKVKGKRYKKSTFANTEVMEMSEFKLKMGMNATCKEFLQQELAAGTRGAGLQLIKAIIQSQVKEQECTGKEVGFGFKQVGIDTESYESCAQDTNVQVTIAYQLVPIANIRSLASARGTQESNVSVQGGGNKDFAAMARRAEEAEAAKRAAQERQQKADAAAEKKAQKKLAKEEKNLKSKASRDWKAIKGKLKSGGTSVQAVVQQYIQSYEGAKLSYKGFSKTANIPEVALAKKWLSAQQTTSSTEEKPAARQRSPAYRAAAHQKRQELIKSYEELLRTSGVQGNQRAELLFRLAEKYFESGKYYYYEEMKSFEKAYDKCFNTPGCDVDKVNADNKQSQIWQKKSISLYNNILKDYPRYSRSDEALFYFGSAYLETKKPKMAVKQFQRLTKEYTRSKYLPDAYVNIGEYYFDQNNAFKALKAYKKATDYTNSSKYGFAMYKLAWCYYNVQTYAEAISSMKAVVSYADRRGDNKSRSLKEEALKDLVRFYVDAGQAKEGAAYFSKMGRENLFLRMQKRLAK